MITLGSLDVELRSIEALLRRIDRFIDEERQWWLALRSRVEHRRSMLLLTQYELKKINSKRSRLS